MFSRMRIWQRQEASLYAALSACIFAACLPVTPLDATALVDRVLAEAEISRDELPGLYDLSVNGSAATVKLSWNELDAIDTVVGYNIYRRSKINSKGARKFSEPEALAFSETGSFIDATANAGQVYAYYVAGILEENVALPPSREVQFTVPDNDDADNDDSEELIDGIDLVIANVGGPDVLALDDYFVVTFDIENRGTEHSGDFTVTVYLGIDPGEYDTSEPYESCEFESLAPGEKRVGQSCSEGFAIDFEVYFQFFVLVEIDSENAVDEADETNNSGEGDILIDTEAAAEPPPGAPGGYLSESEPNNTPSTCDAIGNLDVSIYGVLGSFDYYCFSLAGPATIEFDIDAESLGSPADTYLTVYNSGGAELAANDDGDGLDSFLSYAFAAAGDYVIEVAACCVESGSDLDWYHLHVVNASANADDDDDGLSNGEESELGTDPNDADSDNDGFADGQEVDLGSDPLDDESQPQLFASYNFNLGLQGWTSGGSNNDWSLRSESAINEIAFASQAIGTDGNGFAEEWEQSWIRSPAIAITSPASLYLSFDSLTDNEGCPYDEELVQVSSNGSNWTTLNTTCANFGDDLNNAELDGIWRTWTYSLAAWTSYSNIYVRFYFDSDDDCCGEDGWYIDNVTLHE